MKHTKVLAYLIILLWNSYSLPAPRKGTNIIPETGASAAQNQSGKPQIVYVPVPVVNQFAAEDQTDRDLFMTLLSIAGNFGKILLDPHNQQHVTVGISTMIDGIMQAADMFTRSMNGTMHTSANMPKRTTTISRESFVEALTLTVMRMAQQLMQQAVLVNPQDPKTEFMKIIQLAA